MVILIVLVIVHSSTLILLILYIISKFIATLIPCLPTKYSAGYCAQIIIVVYTSICNNAATVDSGIWD